MTNEDEEGKTQGKGKVIPVNHELRQGRVAIMNTESRSIIESRHHEYRIKGCQKTVVQHNIHPATPPLSQSTSYHPYLVFDLLEVVPEGVHGLLAEDVSWQHLLAQVGEE